MSPKRKPPLHLPVSPMTKRIINGIDDFLANAPAWMVWCTTIMFIVACNLGPPIHPLPLVITGLPLTWFVIRAWRRYLLRLIVGVILITHILPPSWQ